MFGTIYVRVMTTSICSVMWEYCINYGGVYIKLELINHNMHTRRGQAAFNVSQSSEHSLINRHKKDYHHVLKIHQDTEEAASSSEGEGDYSTDSIYTPPELILRANDTYGRWLRKLSAILWNWEQADLVAILMSLVLFKPHHNKIARLII